MRIVWIFLVSATLVAQILTPPAPPKKDEARDALGRQTPRSSMTKFLQAAQGGHYRTAALYLQVPGNRRETQGVRLAQELQALLDNNQTIRLMNFSEKPEGAPEENVAADEDRVGDLVAGNESAPMIMVRVNDPQAGQIWLVSAETLARVPELSTKIAGYSSLVEEIPAGLQVRILNLAAWQWIGGVILALIAYGLAWLLVLIARWATKRTHFKFGKPPRGAVVLLAILVHAQLVRLLMLPLLVRSYYGRAVGVAFLVGITWLVSRGVDRLSDTMRLRALASGRLAVGSWIILGRRLVKILIAFAFILILLNALFDLDVTTALAGLGIGGIAVALAAQKTIENLFGGVSIASDEVIRVGDTIRVSGTQTGTVTDIGLRSTRLRTPERLELSIPNGQLATMNIENISARDKVLFNMNIGLKYETTVEQLERVLTDIRELFAANKLVEMGRVCFAGYTDHIPQIEIFVYILTDDYNQFVVVREQLLLAIMKIIDEAGTATAIPARMLYAVGGAEGGAR